ncbi:hypothetical protein BDY19DRAFT_943557 [Irpex rosettiformis]|uniref:Uncharacterized protein n=1 Tax=Irpex rosettiformis TaxID=378272 RepID=A0ACB8U5I5_9APHY|nr:hypothetical protein BDY19DRAFT_943557 [Irpex rosettiformis]
MVTGRMLLLRFAGADVILGLDGSVNFTEDPQALGTLIPHNLDGFSLTGFSLRPVQRVRRFGRRDPKSKTQISE